MFCFCFLRLRRSGFRKEGPNKSETDGRERGASSDSDKGKDTAYYSNDNRKTRTERKPEKKEKEEVRPNRMKRQEQKEEDNQQKKIMTSKKQQTKS